MNLSFSSTGTTKLLKLIKDVEEGQEKALYRTLKAIQKKMIIDISKQIRNDPKHGLNLTKAYVDSKLKLGRISYTNLEARLSASKRGILLSQFPYTVNSRGVSVKVKRKGRRKTLRGGFILPRLKNSHVTGIAIRRGGKADVLHGPSISQAFDQALKNSDITERLSSYAAERLKKEVESIIRRGR